LNRLFVTYKPTFLGSNSHLHRLKRKYKTKKAGFSGTLDPFAKGVLIIAFGKYTQLFRFLNKTPKTYRATLWLGLHSDTLDIEKNEGIDELSEFDDSLIKYILNSFKGEFTYIPPKYSAKKIAGKRAYDLARANIEVDLPTVTSTVYEIELINYNHPFITFEVTVSEGTYIRSIGEHISKKLGTTGALSSLERKNEGAFFYENEKALNPLDMIDLPRNEYLADIKDVELGRKLKLENLKFQEDGQYLLIFEDMFSIIAVSQQRVSYLLNKVPLC